MHGKMGRRYQISAPVALIAAAALISSPLPAAETPAAPVPQPGVQAPDAAVWCVVPGEIRQLGPDASFITRPPAVRMTAGECAQRGGQIVDEPPAAEPSR